LQEEITQKTLALCVEASKMTAQLLQQAMKKVLADMEKHKKNPQLRHGKQTLRQLMKHNTGVSNIEITDQNIGLVRKYTRARKLTPRMLNELVEKIEVFNAEKIDGVWEQRLRIHYNCVGTIEIPTVLPLPIPEVSINTRKGVVVNYAPCELAV